MRNIIIILFLLIGCRAEQQPYFGRIVTSPEPSDTTTPMLIIFFGESNAGGIAANTSATVPELIKRKLKILNNSTCASFDSLDIGHNNLIGHTGLESYLSTTHGFELQLANMYDSGSFGGRDVYIVKTGQGGTTADDWLTGGTYSGVSPYDTLTKRVDSSVALLTRQYGQSPNIYILFTLGINDGLAATNSATFKTRVTDIINNIRADYGTSPIMLMRLQFSSDYYATQFIEIASELSSVYIIGTTGLGVNGDGWHLNYNGMKDWTRAAINQLVSLL